MTMQHSGRALFGLLTMLAVCCVLSACANLQTLQTVESTARPAYQLQRDMLSSRSGCHYLAVYKKPVVARVGFTVILGHGFLRSQRHLVDLSDAIAKAGIPVITLDFCAMRLWSGHHVFNAAEMRAVAGHYNVQPVVFAGHSAGALAAVLAAAEHPHTVGMVLLDYVDQPPLGRDALDRTKTPAVALFGGPTSCNNNAREVPLLRQRENTIVEHFNTASHCAFESPTSLSCQWFCGRSKGDDKHLRRQIIDRTVEALIGFQAQVT
ncbi:MAG: alpha/beta hydrolase [Pseudomonadota bacterium]